MFTRKFLLWISHEKLNRKISYAFVTAPTHVSKELIKLNGLDFKIQILIKEARKIPMQRHNIPRDNQSKNSLILNRHKEKDNQQFKKLLELMKMQILQKWKALLFSRTVWQKDWKLNSSLHTSTMGKFI